MTKTLQKSIDEDRRKTIDSEGTIVSWSTVQRILTEELTGDEYGSYKCNPKSKQSIEPVENSKLPILRSSRTVLSCG
ncbi:hypothetical protein TNCV_2578431 [Trichonephila clavipes]|nr:hypothetical protein TNCV_2578431 [Trichonephila clavipes]